MRNVVGKCLGVFTLTFVFPFLLSACFQAQKGFSYRNDLGGFGENSGDVLNSGNNGNTNTGSLNNRDNRGNKSDDEDLGTVRNLSLVERTAFDIDDPEMDRSKLGISFKRKISALDAQNTYLRILEFGPYEDAEPFNSREDLPKFKCSGNAGPDSLPAGARVVFDDPAPIIEQMGVKYARLPNPSESPDATELERSLVRDVPANNFYIHAFCLGRFILDERGRPLVQSWGYANQITVLFAGADADEEEIASGQNIRVTPLPGNKNRFLSPFIDFNSTGYACKDPNKRKLYFQFKPEVFSQAGTGFPIAAGQTDPLQNIENRRAAVELRFATANRSHQLEFASGPAGGVLIGDGGSNAGGTFSSRVFNRADTREILRGFRTGQPVRIEFHIEGYRGSQFSLNSDLYGYQNGHFIDGNGFKIAVELKISYRTKVTNNSSVASSLAVSTPLLDFIGDGNSGQSSNTVTVSRFVRLSENIVAKYCGD